MRLRRHITLHFPYNSKFFISIQTSQCLLSRCVSWTLLGYAKACGSPTRLMRGWGLGGVWARKLLERNLIPTGKMWDGYRYGNQVFYTLQAPHECNPCPLHSQALNGHKQITAINTSVNQQIVFNGKLQAHSQYGWQNDYHTRDKHPTT